MKQNSFTGAVLASRAGDIYLITGRDRTGKRAYYYLRVFKGKKPLLDRALRSDKMSLTDFGEVIESGYGETVPEHIREKMRREYGCD